MIKGVHAMFFVPNAEEVRSFVRDKLGLPFSDVGDGWLIFDLEGEVGCHPSEKSFHGISFYCDDIEGTMADLKQRGVEFTSAVKDEGYGLVTTFRMPGGHDVQLYQPRYTKSLPAH